MRAVNLKLLKSKRASRLASFCISLVTTLAAAPPGASVQVKLDIPPALKKGTFTNDRFLNVPPGFKASLFGLVPGARFLAVAPNGDVLVSNPGAGSITLLRPDAASGVPKTFTWVSGLRRPHGIVFHQIGDTMYVYVSESHQIDRYIYKDGDTSAHDREVVVTGLPDSSMPELHGAYGHELKNIALGPDHKLYVSIGSTCNVCTSDTVSNPIRASIYVYNPDGSNGRLFAKGLRNAEGLDFLPGTNNLWVVVNNRDQIPYPFKDSTGNYGKEVTSYIDNHPPDLFTAVRDGGNYGWPFCNSNPDAGLDNMPFDHDMDTNSDDNVNCGAADRVNKGIQAHSAPLGLKFLGNTNFAAAYRNGAVAALHGSWDRSVPTGYKVIYFPFDATTGTPAAQIDLVTGWRNESTGDLWGRPVGVAVTPQGDLLVTDDMAGAVYRISSSSSVSSSANGFGTVAPGSIASVYGNGFGNDTQVKVRDAAGVERTASVIYSSAKQLNVVIPGDTGVGAATLVVNGQTAGTVNVARVAPGLFSLTGDGTGAAAATAVQVVIATHITSAVPVFSCTNAGCVLVPIELGSDAPVYLSLYGTGISPETDMSRVKVTIGGEDAPVIYSGPQTQYPGLDQVNVAVPLSLRGRGVVDVVVTVDDVPSNAVQIAIE
jgi:uncharacterized protein (TIGR03437 family)